MQTFELYDLLPIIVASKGKWAIYLNNNDNFDLFNIFIEELKVQKACDQEQLNNLKCSSGVVVMFFDSEEECNKVYSILVDRTTFYGSALFASKLNNLGEEVDENT